MFRSPARIRLGTEPGISHQPQTPLCQIWHNIEPNQALTCQPNHRSPARIRFSTKPGVHVTSMKNTPGIVETHSCRFMPVPTQQDAGNSTGPHPNTSNDPEDASYPLKQTGCRQPRSSYSGKSNNQANEPFSESTNTPDPRQIVRGPELRGISPGEFFDFRRNL